MPRREHISKQSKSETLNKESAMKANCMSSFKKFLAANRISVYTILGVITGLASGLVAKAVFWPSGHPIDPNLLRYLSLPGLLYIRSFLLLIVPLIITSLSTSFSTEKTTSATNSDGVDINAHKLLLVTFTFFICFSAFTSMLGISLVASFKPGVIVQNVVNSTQVSNQSSHEDIVAAQKQITQSNFRADSVFNIFLNLVPDNIISALFMTSFTNTEVIWPANLSQITEANFVATVRQSTTQSFKANMLGICVISLVLGMLLQKLEPTQTRMIRHLLHEIDLLVKQSMTFLLKLMPVAMFCWMFTEALKMHSIAQVAGQLVYFYAVAFLAFAIVLLLFYPLILFVFTRQNAFSLYSTIFSAILVAIGSTSSAITLPMTMKCMEKAQLSKPIAHTVLPLGMTINMNGTAMYYPMVALFVAQMKQVEVDLFSMIILGIFSVAMSMGFPGTPSGGSVIVNHITFASIIAVDEPQDVLAYIMAFEWIMERIRTPVNIIGDCFAAKCIEKLIIGNKVQQGETTTAVDLQTTDINLDEECVQEAETSRL